MMANASKKESKLKYKSIRHHLELVMASTDWTTMSNGGCEMGGKVEMQKEIGRRKGWRAHDATWLEWIKTREPVLGIGSLMEQLQSHKCY